MAEARPFTLEDAYLGEDEAARLLEGRRIRRGDRVMDPKAQLLGEFIVSLRPPDQLPTPEESRVQFRRMVDLFDGPPPKSVRHPRPRLPRPGRGGAAAPVRARRRGRSRAAPPLPPRRRLGAGRPRHAPRRLRQARRLGGLQGAGRRLPPGPRAQVPGRRRGLPRPPGAGSRRTRVARRRPGPARDRRRLGGGNLTAAVCQIVAGEYDRCRPPSSSIYPSVDLGWELPSHRELKDAFVLPRVRVLWYTGPTWPRPSRSRTCGLATPCREPARPAARHDRHRRASIPCSTTAASTPSACGPTAWT